MTKSLAMVFTYHTMAELLVVTSIAELQKLLEKDVKCSSAIGFTAEVKSK